MTAARLHEGAVVEGTVDALDDEGRGRIAAEPFDLCVRGAFIGDHVRAAVERVFPASGVAQARALAIVAPGPVREPRRCPHAAPCPGCPLHGLIEEAAHDLKVARIARALADVGLTAPIDDVVRTRGPRQKVKLMVDRGRVGLYVPHSHVLIDADRCTYHHIAINVALARLRPLLTAPVRAVIARIFREGVGVVLVSGAPLHDDALAALRAHVDGQPIASIAVRVDAGGTNSVLGGAVERVFGPRLMTPLDNGPAVTPDAFCQPDAYLALLLYEAVATWLVARGAGGAFADLYAGTGGFSRALLKANATDVLAVERATESAAALAALPIRHVVSTVEDALPALAGSGSLAGIVADPPKKGLGETAAALARLGAARVALVACDPDAGARDAKVFVDAGYTIERVTPYDLFPGTPDVESLILLTRS